MTDEKDLEMTPDQNGPERSKPSAPDSGSDQDQVSVGTMDKASDVAGDGHQVVNPGDASEDAAEAAMMAMLSDLPDEESSMTADDIDFGSAEVADAEFQQLSAPANVHSQGNIDLLMDVDLPVAIELGRTEMTINEILALGPGSVVELNKLAGEPVDLLVNSKVVARGEVVVVDENFGLRVTHLLTPEERLRSLADA